MRSSLERRTLLNILRASLDEAAIDPAIVPLSLDWSLLQRLVCHNRIGPLLSYGLHRSRIIGIPDWLAGEWEAQRRETIATTLYLQQTLGELVEAFERSGIPFVLLKGEALSRAFYPEDGLRPYGDIDLLIRPASYKTVRDILMGFGFQLRQPTLETEKRELFGEVEFDRKGHRVLTVDLHWDTLMASWGPPSLMGDASTWGSLERIECGGRLVPVMGGDSLILFLCVHFAFHHVLDGLILLCDLFLVLRRDAHRIDWDRLVLMARHYRCLQAVYYALTSAQRLLGAQIPSVVFEYLMPATAVRLLMPVDRLLVRARPVPQMLERFVKLLMIDDQAGRWKALQSWWRSSKPWLVHQAKG
jgi:hypothetical protein